MFPGLKDALESHPNLFLIIAPHEPTEDHLSNAENYFSEIPMSRWSNMSSESEQVRILLIDSVGILAALYHHSQMAYVGGAFTTGVHNVLEPAVMGATIAFGPKHSNSMESLQMLEQGLAACVKNADEFHSWMFNLLDDRKRCKELGKQSQSMLKGRQERQRDVSLYWSADLKFSPQTSGSIPILLQSQTKKIFSPSSLPHFQQSEGSSWRSKGYIKGEGKDDVEIEQIHPFLLYFKITGNQFLG
ncbi:MAG: hypothetical protein CM1200mP30_29310 [Pseudomonadota bacterium]|nr:MAG: hypothetical protein CM1200mP30_29310 [Pseudomonadota bacterium]